MRAPTEPFAGRTLGNRTFELGEGPIYDSSTDTAWWLDILGQTLVAYDFAADEVTLRALSLIVSALVFAEDGRQILVTENGLSFRDRETGALSTYLDIEADNPLTRSNDARVHPSGALWMGTMGKDHGDGAGAIYHVFKGEVRSLYAGISIPNAICFSPAGDVGYFADTMKGDVMRVALDARNGTPTGEPAIFLPRGSSLGSPDGAIVDRDGNFWNARWGAGRVDCHSAAGVHLRSIALPAKCVSCPAFVGKAADRLIVTSSYEGFTAEDRLREPAAGATFLLDLQIEGRFEPRMAL